jgi:UDP-N-acetylmuramyl pentapeptide phosphotransferase/UDP-N-acetylglucosamine-1-phosphate transferase
VQSVPALPAAIIAAIILTAGVIACLGTRALIPLLRRASVIDRPNERSSHIAPMPRGGGIAVVCAVLLAWLALIAWGPVSPTMLVVLFGAGLLAVVSWLDDLRGLSPAIRLPVQLIAVALGMIAAAPAGPVFQGWLPPWLDTVAAALLWLWFVNLFNFMDGIDGLAGSEAVAIGLGLVLFAGIGAGGDPGVAVLAAALAVAALGFLVWNWAPAQIFLGDVGSVPLGYLLGFLLLVVAGLGHWKVALILPLYFLADATITLLHRLARGERVWQAHREHFYQRAVRRGLGHAAIVRRVVAVNIVLIACAGIAERGLAVIALAAAVVAVGLLLANLAGAGSRPASQDQASRRTADKP